MTPHQRKKDGFIPTHWHRIVLVLFILFQYGDVFFGSRSLNTLAASPANFPIGITESSGWLSGTALDRFQAGVTADRALWDRPLVYDPNLAAAHHLLKSGEVPLRNPYLGLGLPLFANGVDFSLSIPGLIMSTLNSANWDYVYLGMYLLSALLILEVLHRYYGNTRSASLVGAIVVSASGLFVPQLSFGGEIINVHACILGVFAVEILCAHGSRKFLGSLLLILALTQAAYAGMPEGTVAVYCMLGGYALVRLLGVLSVVGAIATCFWIFSVALLLSAPYLGLLFYYSKLMTHAHEVGHMTLPALHLPELFLPYLRGWTFDQYFLERYPHRLNIVFVGFVPVLVFALRLLLHTDAPVLNRRSIFPIGAIVFYLTQSFGTQYFGAEPLSLNFIGSLPILKQVFFFRFFAPIFVIAVALLVAEMLSSIERSSTVRYSTAGASSIALISVGYFLYLHSLVLEVGSLHSTAEFISKFLAWNLPNTLTVGGATLLLFVLFLFRPAQRLISIAVVCTTLVISNYHFSKSFYPKRDAFAPLPVTKFLRDEEQKHGPFRFYSSQQLFPGTASGYLVQDIRHMNPVVPEQTISLLQSLFGKYATGKVSWERFETLNDEPGGAMYSHPAFDLLNVRYFIFPAWSVAVPKGHHFPEVYRDSADVIVRNRGVKPRVFVAKQWEVLPAEQSLTEWVEGAGEKIRDTAVLREAPVWSVDTINKPDQKKPRAKLVEVKNSDYRISVSLPERAILLVSDGFMPGFRAFAGGKELSVIEAYDGMIAVLAPAGTYELKLSYRPPIWWMLWSCFAAGLGILTVTGGLILWGKPKADR